MAKLSAQDVIASLKEMTILEINDLVKAIEEEFGVSAAAPAAAGPAAAAEAPSEVTIKLVDSGANKVGVIKVVREITGLGLMEAKAAVDATPSVIKENIKPEEAAELKKKFEEAGAKVEIA
ncbi:MAG: 50S ribosomal protein L7/L12 [Mycoplasma sp.]